MYTSWPKTYTKSCIQKIPFQIKPEGDFLMDVI